MEIAVRYQSRGGNTKKLAEAIAKAVGTRALDCSHPITNKTDLLILGGSVYAFGLDEHIREYISELDPKLIERAAVFGTSAIVKNGNTEMIKLLSERNIPVLKDQYYCRGEFKFMHKGRPNSADISEAENFAKSAVKAIKG